MLTNEQIQLIDAFIAGKGIKYYDLRQELVDHFATEMEQDASITCIITVVKILFRFKKAKLPLLLVANVKKKSVIRNLGLLVTMLLNGYLILKKDFPTGPAKTLQAFIVVFVTIIYPLAFIARYHAVKKMYSEAHKMYPIAFE